VVNAKDDKVGTMKHHFGHFLLAIFLSATAWSDPYATCKEVYTENNGTVVHHFDDEIGLIAAMKKTAVPLLSNIYKKYRREIKSTTFLLNDLFDVLRIGFDEQIFCNPWPEKIPEIMNKLKAGEYTNSLIREIRRYQEKQLGKELSFNQTSEQLDWLAAQIGSKYPSPFPQSVEFRNHRSDYTSNFYYYLSENGKFFIKPNPKHGNIADIIKFGTLEKYIPGEKLGNRTEWTDFNHGEGPDLARGRKLVGFSVASEIVQALDSAGQFHLYKPTELETPTKWTTRIGCPVKEKLYKTRGISSWTSNCSVTHKEETRRTNFMHERDVVKYYTDGDGKKIAFGFTATTYLLSEDGRAISYWDTGLPGNFARFFSTPHRGNFIAEEISAAGSTVMIIGKNSEGKKEIYTRMFDYEINGACPGQQHTYLRTDNPDSNYVWGLIEARRRLPLPGWIKMADIPLSDMDTITNRISIELTGAGNSARLLKVEGTKDGVHGYYYKMIDDNEWAFARFKHPHNERFLSPLNERQRDPSEYLKRNDMDYAGKLSLAYGDSMFDRTYQLDLKNFHYFLGADEPATIELSDDQGVKLVLMLHTNDSWTLTTQMRRHEFLIGNKDGEPKPLTGTLIIPEEYLYSDDPTVRSLVKVFMPFHTKVNAFGVLANDEFVSLKSVTKFIDMDDSFVEKSLPDMTLDFRRNNDKPGYYDQLINRSEYLLTNVNDKKHVQEVFDRNIALIQDLDSDKEHVHSIVKNNFFASGTSLAMEIAARAFKNYNDPLVQSIRKSVTHTAKQYQKMNFGKIWTSSQTNEAIGRAKMLVNKRVKEYYRYLEFVK
jgi:hypothetical protein